MPKSKNTLTSDPLQDPILASSILHDDLLELYAHLGQIEAMARAARGLIDLMGGPSSKGHDIASKAIDETINEARALAMVHKKLKGGAQ